MAIDVFLLCIVTYLMVFGPVHHHVLRRNVTSWCTKSAQVRALITLKH